MIVPLGGVNATLAVVELVNVAMPMVGAAKNILTPCIKELNVLNVPNDIIIYITNIYN